MLQLRRYIAENWEDLIVSVHFSLDQIAQGKKSRIQRRLGGDLGAVLSQVQISLDAEKDLYDYFLFASRSGIQAHRNAIIEAMKDATEPSSKWLELEDHGPLARYIVSGNIILISSLGSSPQVLRILNTSRAYYPIYRRWWH